MVKKNKSIYNSLSEWRNADLKTYNSAYRRGYLDDICEHFGWEKPKKQIRKAKETYKSYNYSRLSKIYHFVKEIKKHKFVFFRNTNLGDIEITIIFTNPDDCFNIISLYENVDDTIESRYNGDSRFHLLSGITHPTNGKGLTTIRFKRQSIFTYVWSNPINRKALDIYMKIINHLISDSTEDGYCGCYGKDAYNIETLSSDEIRYVFERTLTLDE
jgi:hypothetical protein